MTGLLLNEQTWLTLIYFVVLPLLVVGLAVTRMQRKEREGRKKPPPQTSAPIDPTPMVDDDRLPPIELVRSREKLVGYREEMPTVAAATPMDPAEAEARLATTTAHLDAARSQLAKQEAEISGLRSELEQQRQVVATQRAAMERMESQLVQQQAQLERWKNAPPQSRDHPPQPRHPRHVLHATEPLDTEGSFDILDDDDDTLMPMPASMEDDHSPGGFGFGDEVFPEISSALRRNRVASDSRLLTPEILAQVGMSFDGSTEIRVSEEPFSALSRGAFTVEAWIRPTMTRIPGAVVSYTVEGRCRLALCAGGPRPSLDVHIDGKALPNGQEPRLTAGVWQHVAVSWNSDGGQLRIYLDGTEAWAGPLAPGARLPPGGRLLLGQELSRDGSTLIPGRAFQGSMAELRFWSYTRSAAQLRRASHRRVPLELDLEVWRRG